MNIIPYGKQNITDADIEAVIGILKSDFLTQGPVIAEFEKKFAEYIGAKYSVAVSNGTAALHLCALAMDVQEGDKVITTPITFAASANCIRYCDGEVVFADIDRATYLIDFEKIKELLNNSPKGSYKGIIPVDFGGRAIDMESLRKIADEHGLWIIEDACHAPGGFFTDSTGTKQSCGNGKYADLAIFSFHPVKHIATGEGGMITTNRRDLYERLMMLRTHGITKDHLKFSNSIELAIGDKGSSSESYPGWYMEMQELGYNYRITDFQAGLGISQLNRAEEGLIKRLAIAKKYESAFQGKTFIRSQSGFNEGHAYHLYIIELTEKRLELYNFLKANNISPQIHYIPCHFMPYYQEQGYKEGDFIFAEEYYNGCLSLPIYPTLTETEQEFVINKINEFFN